MSGFANADDRRLYAAVAGCALVVYLGALWNGFAVDDVPIIVLMVALLEASGLNPLLVYILMTALLVARILHPIGMQANSSSTLQFQLGRVSGMALTIIVMIASALLILSRISLTLF